MTLTVGSLFSGIGGLDLGLSWAGMRHKWFVEQNPDRQTVLADHWPDATIYGDIDAIDLSSLAPVDLIVGGFPCQGFSLAGIRKGTADDRFLWPKMFEVVQAVRPRWVLAENVPGITSTESGVAVSRVFFDLESCGYDLLRGPDGHPALLDIPACGVNAPHIRHRVFFVGHRIEDDMGDPCREGLQAPEQPGKPGAKEARPGEGRGTAAQPGGTGSVEDSAGRDDECQGERHEAERERGHRPAGGVAGPSSPLDHWDAAEHILCNDGKARRVPTAESRIRLVAHGVPRRLAQISGAGDAVVPQVAYMIGRAIIQADTEDLA